MELIPGYKQSEAGSIPNDWTAEPLGPHVEIRSGESPSLFHFENEGVPYFKVEQLNNNSKYLRDTSYFIRGSNKVPRGSLIFPKRGASILLNKVRILAMDSFMDTNLMTLTPKPSVHHEFLYYALTHIELWRIADTTSIPQINNKHIIPLIVAFPPTKAEQEAIAEALSDVDALIESLEQLIAKKRNLKQGAMQELLTGKKRLPGFEVSPGYNQTEVGLIPADWGIKRLGELFEITSSKRVFQSEWKSEGIPFYRARELAVLGDKGYVENDLFISKEMYDSFKNIYGVPEVGDMLVTGVGTLGKAYVVSDDRAFYFKDGNIIWFKIRGKVRSDFLKQLFLTRVIIKQIDDASAGTTVGTYTITGAMKTTIPFPSVGEQEAIAAVLSDLDAEIAALEAKLAKARKLKRGMMQELLTGKVRLV